MRKLCLLTKSSSAMTTNKWLVLAFVAALSAFRADMAGAHALLDHADPRVGNTVNPRMVSLWFTQNLESSFSGIEVLDANGQPVNTGRAVVDSNDRELLRVPVKALPAGTYTVRWHVLSVDTHTTQGNFTFRVEP
jgi:copper resistance protein C